MVIRQTPMELPDESRMTAEDSTSIAVVMAHALELTTRLDQQSVLQSLVDSAAALTGARYAALGVLDNKGNTLQFVFAGIDQPTADAIGHPPIGYGVFSDIPSDTYIIVNDLASYENHYPWPEHHPVMENFIGLPIRSRGRVYGRLYLADKPGGFTIQDGDNMMLLCQAAAIAIENSRLYAESNTRAQWISTSRTITTTLLEGSDEEEALELICREMRRTSRADIALLVLPSLGETWVCEIADGEGAFDFIGLSFPPNSYAQTAIREGNGLIVDSLNKQKNLPVPELARFGPALYAPMSARGQIQGVIILLRSTDQTSFDISDLSMAENVAKQAALALTLSEARQSEAKAEQMEDRAQISRDLHDFAIQQLFATGMELSAAREKLAGENADVAILDALDRGIASIDESVGQIRQIIYSLRDPNATIPLLERLRHELKQATNSLGFAPNVYIRNLGEDISLDDESNHTEIDDELGSDIADDVIAVTRECLSNAARHAQASGVKVSLIVENHRVSLTIADDGKGVDPEVSRRSGLSNLATRARRHHGTFAIREGEGGRGTAIEWVAVVD